MEQQANQALEPKYNAYWQSLPKYTEVSPLVWQAQQAPYFRVPNWQLTPDPVGPPGGASELVFVYNHKTGENLHRSVMHALPWQSFEFRELHEPDHTVQVASSSRILHFVRDPVDVILSGYRYHQEHWGAEMWSWGGRNRTQDPPCFHCDAEDHAAIFETCHFDCTYFELLNRADETTGVVLEALSARQTLQIMAMNMARWKERPNVLQLSMDQIEADPTKTSACLLNFLGLGGHPDLMMEMSKAVTTVGDPDHVTAGHYDNTYLREMLQDHPVWGPTFHEMRAMMTSIFKRQSGLYGCLDH